MLFGVGDGIERRLGVAGAGQHPREIAGLGPPAAVVGVQERLDQPQEGPPGFHRGAEIVHRDRLDALPVLDRGPALGEDVAGDGPQRRVRPLPAVASPACHSCDGSMTMFCDSLDEMEPSAPFPFREALVT